jgi:ADP-heptose:LPS heptosyltransferase
MPSGLSIPRPLLVRCGAFGDMVLVTALIRDLAARFGTVVDVLTSGPWSEPLLRGQPGVGDMVTVRSRKTPYLLSLDQRRAVHWLRRRGVGPTWFCDGNDAAHPMLDRAGIAGSYIVELKDHPLLPGEHATQQWRRFARLTPAAVSDWPAPPLEFDAAAGGCILEVFDSQRADLASWLARRGLSNVPLIAIQMGNKRTMRRGLRRLAANSKHWPLERWAAVLRHLRQLHPQHALVLLGTGPEWALNQELLQAARIDGVHNVADDLPVPRLVALLAASCGLLTVDSGPAHVAAAVGCPQVTLFGKASTTLYRPWGQSGADVKVLSGSLEGQPNMLGITTEQVIAAWEGLKLRSVAERAACPASPA